MTMGMQAVSGRGRVYIILIFCRCILKWGDGSCGTDKRPGIGIAQTTGSRQVQADVAQIWDSNAGLMAVIADGIGSANTGKVCAQVAADAILDRYEPYCELNDPVYFFRTSFLEASQRIQRTIGERRGGASTGAVFINRSHLYYAVAGDIRVAVMRGGEMIPLSKGQTLDVLAAQAYEDGIEVNFTAEKPTLIVHNVDQPGHVAQVTGMLAERNVNIATLQLYRDKRGGYAVMVIETDQEVPQDSVEWLEQLNGIIKVTYINVED